MWNSRSDTNLEQPFLWAISSPLFHSFSLPINCLKSSFGCLRTLSQKECSMSRVAFDFLVFLGTGRFNRNKKEKKKQINKQINLFPKLLNNLTKEQVKPGQHSSQNKFYLIDPKFLIMPQNFLDIESLIPSHCPCGVVWQHKWMILLPKSPQSSMDILQWLFHIVVRFTHGFCVLIPKVARWKEQNRQQTHLIFINSLKDIYVLLLVHSGSSS